MRHLSALIVGLGLSLPAIGHASVPERTPLVVQSSVNQSSVQAPAPTARAAQASTRNTAAPSHTQAATDDKSRYAAREAASPEAQAYRGGDTLVIGATTATIILAIVLLVVLL